MGLLGDDLPFARALTLQENEGVIALGTRKRFVADAQLLAEGDRTSHVVVILHGWATVSVATDRGATGLILGLRGPGELLGELAALDRLPRSATVRALGPVDALLISGDAFRRFLAQNPRVSSLVMHQLASRLRSSDRERSVLASLTVLQRLASRLVELGLAETAGPYSAPYGRPNCAATKPGCPSTTVIHLAQDELAATVGATREAVAKALRLLREQHVVRTGNRMVEILDPALLALLATGHDTGGRDGEGPV